jgi:Ca2+-binding EF-hand superfamily protein
MASKGRMTREYLRRDVECRAALREHFDFCDVNRDGKLTLGEFIRFMRNLDEDVTAEECELCFSEVDRNRNGVVELDEFLRWWTEP